MSTVLEHSDGCAEQYRCTTVIYLLSMLSHAYNSIIGSGIIAPGHVREVVDGLNSTNKWFISMLMPTVQLPGAASYDSQMTMNTSNTNTDISLAREFQKHISSPTRAYGLLDHGKYRKSVSKRKWTDSEYHVQECTLAVHT